MTANSGMAIARAAYLIFASNPSIPDPPEEYGLIENVSNIRTPATETGSQSGEYRLLEDVLVGKAYAAGVTLRTSVAGTSCWADRRLGRFPETSSLLKNCLADKY